jgi:anti-sigma B factor antagonist
LEGADLAPTTLEDVRVERPADGTAVVVFSGEHDLLTKVEVRDLLDSLLWEGNLLVADFSSASFVDSSILGVLLDTNQHARELGKTFRLQLGTAAIVQRAFEICGVFEVIERVATREEALVAGEQ